MLYTAKRLLIFRDANRADVDPRTHGYDMKINVTGSAGAGKTTFAKRLAHDLGIPALHLDAIVWQPGWQKTPPMQRQALESEMMSQADWVIDGVSEQVRQQADLVIVLTTPRARCMKQALARNLPYLFKSRPGLPENCPEILILPKLVQMIWRYPKLLKPIFVAEAEHSEKYLFASAHTDYATTLQRVKLSA